MKYIIVIICLWAICGCNEKRETVNSPNDPSNDRTLGNVATTDPVKLVRKVTREINLQTGDSLLTGEAKLFKVYTRTGSLVHFQYDHKDTLLLSPLPTGYEYIITYEYRPEMDKCEYPPVITDVKMVTIKPRQ